MAERPIIFSGAMVWAILAGRKTETRRVLKPQPEHRYVAGYGIGRPGFSHEWTPCGKEPSEDAWKKWAAKCAVRYLPGDELWVRETWGLVEYGAPSPSGYPLDPDLVYRADDPEIHESAFEFRWRSPIHMRRRNSRITLRVTEVRVQRLQEITPADAISEGIDPEPHRCGCERCGMTSELCPATASSLIEDFGHLWNSINGKKPGARWEDNPWVAAISFQKERG